ncbi:MULTISPECIES: hypothetical protein [unclassified Streptomyces]|uniref:WXG100-like domain-containing protein n=1 Tax=unclassified Streptomyces TaxID=2593676 RepID=UPI0036E70F8D
MSVADKAKKIVQDMTGMWWPDADEDGLRHAAKVWRDFADDLEDVTAAANKSARGIITHNKGEAISAFDDPYWRRYYHDGHGWLQDMIDGARDVAKSLDQYADAVHHAVKRLEHELEIVGATIAAGTLLAVFTAGISEAAAAAATATIVDLAATVGVAVSTEIATIATTTLATAAIAGIESITVDLAVTQPMSIALGESKGLNLDEAHDAMLYGALTGGALGGAGATYRAAQNAGGMTELLGGVRVPGFGPNLALPGGLTASADELGDLGMLMRSGEGGGGSAGRGSWPASDAVTGPAAGKTVRAPHPRHTVSGAAHGNAKEVNSVVLRGYERQVNQDVEGIAAGRASFDKATSRYEINGRTYGVEESGTVFPDGGEGIVRLDRNEYAALQQVAKAKGNLDAAPQLTRNPRFTQNPGVVEKALAIYNGTYQ